MTDVGRLRLVCFGSGEGRKRTFDSEQLRQLSFATLDAELNNSAYLAGAKAPKQNSYLE
jgi:hypothetical protein